MAVGGATWDTAGTLEVGSGNTFLIADATGSADVFDNVAWWTFTPTADVVGRFTVLPAITDNVGFRLYSGADEASKVLVPRTFEDFTQVSTLSPGVTYHLLVGTFDTVEEPSYQVTYAPTQLTLSPWLSTLRDRDDNQLIVSSGELIAENASTEFQFRHDWYESVFGTPLRHPPGRRSGWMALQTLGGPSVLGARDCVWEHATNGDVGGEGGWDGGCDPLGTGDNRDGDSPAVSWSLRFTDPGGPIADAVAAEVAVKAQALWLAQVREHLDERGTFTFPNPVTDGYPEGAQIEWEGELELVKVELTGDAETRPAETAGIDPVLFMLRRGPFPDYTPADPSEVEVWTNWYYGPVNIWDGTKSDLTFEYLSGDPVWTELDYAVSGDDGWDALSTSYDEQPDEIVATALTVALGPTPSLGENVRDATTAIRYTFRSPRYRWVYVNTTTTIPPRRIFQRSDGATHGARRVFGGGNTRQSGSRTLGSIL